MPEPVGVGPRALAYVIDIFVFAVMVTIVDVASGDSTGNPGHELLNHPYSAASLLMMTASLVYFGGLESAWGATVGKRALGLRVAMTGGGRPTGRAVLLRTIGRVPDCIVFSPLVAAILVASSPRRQRLGDRWAGTTVVRSRR